MRNPISSSVLATASATPAARISQSAGRHPAPGGDVRASATIAITPTIANRMPALAIRLNTRGMSPESSGARSRKISRMPMSTPEITASRMPRGFGRTAPFSGTNPTSTTATSASPRAM